MSRRPRRRPSTEGLREYALLTAFLALAVAGALILFGDDIKGALGLGAQNRPPPPPSGQR